MLLRLLSGILFLTLLGLVVYDGKFHFDAQHVKVKHKHYSAQRHWNIHYVQQYVFGHSSIRYQTDLQKIASLVEPGSVLLSDLASSYYAAAQLPVYIRNVHSHHRGTVPIPWRQLLSKRYACYLEFAENRAEFADILEKIQPFDYWLVNKDGVNRHRKKDCLAFRAHTLRDELPKFSELLWSGEYLDLYALRDISDQPAETP